MSLISESDPLVEKRLTASIPNTSKHMLQNHEKKEDDASSVGGSFESDDDTVYRLSSFGLELKGSFMDPEYEDAGKSVDEEEVLLERVDKLKLTEEERHYVYIYGYYHRREAFGGYGIIVLNGSREPISAYCGATKGGSYLYHLLVGMKRGLQIASKQGLTRVEWSINSDRAAHYFNRYASDTCLKYLGLSDESFEVMVPVIEGIKKLQYDTRFKYNRGGEALHYVARCGAELWMKLRLMSPGEDEGIDMKMVEPEKLTPIVQGEASPLVGEWWYVLERGPRLQKVNEPPSSVIQDDGRSIEWHERRLRRLKRRVEDNIRARRLQKQETLPS